MTWMLGDDNGDNADYLFHFSSFFYFIFLQH